MTAAVGDRRDDDPVQNCPGCGTVIEDAAVSDEPAARDGLRFCGPACWHEWASTD